MLTSSILTHNGSHIHNYNYLFVDLISIDRETYIVDPHGFFNEEEDQSSTGYGQQGSVPQRLGSPFQLSLTNVYLKQTNIYLKQTNFYLKQISI